jgi:hypothetical protein
LIGIFARQPVWRVDIEPIAASGRRDLPEALQGGAHEGRSTIAVVQTPQGLGHHQASGGDTLA